MKSSDSEAYPNAVAQISLLQGKAEVEAAWSFRKQSASQRLPRLALVKNNDPLSSSGLNPESSNLEQRSVCHGNPALGQLASISSLLMLQGPVGPLFSRIAAWKRDMGHQVRRVIFNSGDAGFCDDIQGVILFGQTRFYHRQAIELCQRMGIPVFVMEEGYVRPGFVTLEMTGVNANSTTLKTHVLSAEGTAHNLPPAATRAYRFKLIFCAMEYYLRLKAGSWWYPHYVHHRDSTIWGYVKYWVRAGVAYPYTRWQDKRELKRLDKSKPYFFVPMQLDSDAQILFHSRYTDVMAFVDEVLESFAAHATDNSQLLIKQHPLARGHLDARQRVLCKAADLGIAHRVIFVHACKIYQLLEGVAGVVTVNSTVGVQAITHAAPLKIMGEAIYDHPDVADSQPLDSFWRNPFRPNPDRAKAFHQQLKLLTQVPAALYDGPGVPLRWGELLRKPRGNHQ